MNSTARLNLLDFITTFLMILLSLAVAYNVYIDHEISLALIGSGFLSALLYATYLNKAKRVYTKPAWIVSIVLGAVLYGLIFDGKGERGAYAFILLFPVIVYPLLGLKKATYAYTAFGISVWLTTLYGTQNWALQEPYMYLLNITLTLFVGGIVVYHAEQVAKSLIESFHKSSITDPLTGLWNRKMSDDMLDRVTDESKRYNKNYSMIMLDIDFFKKINDKYGHHVGDQVLIEFAKVVKENTRKSDMLFRWGGEEFLIILPNTDINGAAIAADKIISKVRDHNYPKIQKGMTVSAGVAENNDNSDKESFFRRVDKALYQAKNQGRDKYIIAQ